MLNLSLHCLMQVVGRPLLRSTPVSLSPTIVHWESVSATTPRQIASAVKSAARPSRLGRACCMESSFKARGAESRRQRGELVRVEHAACIPSLHARTRDHYTGAEFSLSLGPGGGASVGPPAERNQLKAF